MISRSASRFCDVVADAVNLGEERDVLVDAQVAVEAEALREIADFRRDRAMVLDRIVAGDADRAAVGVQQAAQQSNRRCLSGTVRADEAEHLAAVDGEREPIDRDGAPVALGDAIKREHVRLPWSVDRRPWTVVRGPWTVGRHGTACSGITASTGIPCFENAVLVVHRHANAVHELRSLFGGLHVARRELRFRRDVTSPCRRVRSRRHP